MTNDFARVIGKDSGSGESGCPAVAQATSTPANYQNKDADGGYWFITVDPTPEERTQAEAAFAAQGITVGPGESLGFVPANVVRLTD